MKGKPNTAFLGAPKSRSESSPDFSGTFVLSDDLVEAIANARGEVKLRVAMWEKNNSYGPYYSAVIKLDDYDGGRGSSPRRSTDQAAQRFTRRQPSQDQYERDPPRRRAPPQDEPRSYRDRDAGDDHDLDDEIPF